MPGRLTWNLRRPRYWWNEEVAELRRTYVKQRRIYQRAGSRGGDRSAEQEDFKHMKKRLKSAIRDSQRAWKALTESVEKDPWGLTYKLVVKKLVIHPPGAEARGREMQISRELFPEVAPQLWEEVSYLGRLGDRSDEESIPFYTCRARHASEKNARWESPLALTAS